MPYNNATLRTDAEALIPEDVATDIITHAPEKSVAMTNFRPVRLANNQRRMPVLSALPQAYWVNGDTGLKQTTETAWDNKFLNVEELAVIVPIPEAVIDDAAYDIWGEIRPLIEEAIARAFDAAVFFGIGAGGLAFPTDVAAAAIAAANNHELGTSTAAQGGVVGDLYELLGLVEDDGHDPTGYFADRRLRRYLRQARATDGNKLGDVTAGLDEVGGDPVMYGARGLWPQASSGVEGVIGFAGDWTQFVFGLRKDITYKVLTEAVITDDSNNIIFNLPQQDMVALRAVFRGSWQVANPITHEQTVEADRYPAAVLETPALP